MFVVQHHCFWFQKTKFKNTNFWSKGGLQHNGFFVSNCVLQNVMKSYRFFWGPFFWQFFGCFSQNTIKIGILAHFSKQNITKKMTFLNVFIWSKLSVIIWSKLGAS